MSIKIKRYNIILKLAVALAILGCFFIANGRTVKAAASASGFSVTDGTLTCTVADFGDSDRLGFYFGNDSNKVIKQGLKSSDFTGNSCTVTAAEILQAVANNELTINSDHTFDIYYAVYTEGATPTPQTAGSVKTAAIYSAEAGTNIKVEPVNDNAKVKTDEGTNTKAYCYTGGTVKYTYTAAIPTGQRLTGWTETNGGKDVSATDSGWVGLTYTTTIKTDSHANIKIEAKGLTDVIKDFDLEPKDGSSLYFQKNPTTPETNSYTLKAKNADGNNVTVSFNEVVFSADDGSGAFTSAYYPEATPTEFRVSSKTGTNTDIKLVATVKHGNNDGSDKAFSVVLNVYNGFDTADSKNISINGSVGCGYNSTEGPYSVVSSSAGKATGNVDIKEYSWTITRVGSAATNGLVFYDTNNTASTLETPSVKATAALGSQYTIKVTATDYFGKTKEATKTITIVDPSITLTLEYDEYGVYDGITNGYYMLGIVNDYPTGSLSSPSPCTISITGEKATPTKKNATYNPAKEVWEAIIQGGTVKNGTVSKITSDVDASVTAEANVTGVKSVTEKFTVYPSPKDSWYDDATRNLKIMLPVPLNLGTVKSNGSERTEGDDCDYVTGYKLDVSRDGTSLSSTTNKTANTDGETKAVQFSSSSLEKIVTDNKSKFSGDQDSIDLTLNFYGGEDEDGEDAELIEDIDGKAMKWTKNVPVYKVAIVGDSGLSSTTAYTYGLEGQEVSLAASVKSGYKITGWSDSTSYSSSVRKVTVSSDTSKNKYTVNTANSSSTSTSSSSTSKTSGGTGSDYDDVPKTSESNAPIWLIIFMVFAVIGSGYALYMQLKPVSAQDDSYEEEDEE